jgi:N-acetylneuraminic acid mutarotase
MKKLLFIITIILFAFSSQAQGTLQFNQVVTITADTSFWHYGNFEISHEFSLYTSPTDKVVKIVNAQNYKSTTGSNSCIRNDFTYTINGIKTSSLNSLWIKEGDIIGAYVYLRTDENSETCSQQDDMFISLIEYNIIPE